MKTNKTLVNQTPQHTLANQTQLPEHSQKIVSEILDKGTPDNTKASYHKDLKYFWAWYAASEDQPTVDPTYPINKEKIIEFITDHLGGMPYNVEKRLIKEGVKQKMGPHKLSTIERRIYNLSTIHKIQGISINNPCINNEIKILLSKARRALAGTSTQKTKKKAITLDTLFKLLDTCESNSLPDIRDKAILIVGFSGAMRRSEIANMTNKNLTIHDDDYTYRIDKSKSDQTGEGRYIAIKGLAANLLRDWIEQANIHDGNIFRSFTKAGGLRKSISDKSIYNIVKQKCSMAGLDHKEFGAHSLRSGFVTEAGKQGVAIGDAMAITGHTTLTVFLDYYQSGDVLNNPAGDITNTKSSKQIDK